MKADQLSQGGKSQMEKLLNKELFEEAVAVKSNHTEEQHLNKQPILQQHDQPEQVYQNIPTNQIKDPKLLTKSTLSNEIGAQRPQYLPTLGQENNNGYISDFYRNKQLKSDKQQYISEESNKNSIQNAAILNSQPYEGLGNVPTNGNPANMLNKISSKKFFKSKIDFAAPIKSLQHKGGTNDPNLSDDSFIENQNTAFRHFNNVT